MYTRTRTVPTYMRRALTDRSMERREIRCPTPRSQRNRHFRRVRDVIVQAIKDSPSGKSTVAEIVEYVLEVQPYLVRDEISVPTRIRRELVWDSDLFVKVSNVFLDESS